MTTYQKFKKLNIRHSAIGLEQSDTDVTYYCTPRDAAIIGWAGVDGIHYCTIPEFGEMIFAVSPMNFGDCVHPIAHSFEDLLRLLLSCGSMDALEQCYAWDEEQFKAFLIDCPATEEQQSVLDVLRTEFRLVPLEDAFAYVKKLQAEFDLSQIPYTEEYYDPDMNAAAPVRAEEWKVTYDGGFWRNEGNAGIEIPIQKSFCWGEEKWYIPAVYICDKGLVIDYCKQADPVQVKAFIDKWDLLNEGNNPHIAHEGKEVAEKAYGLPIDPVHELIQDCRGDKIPNKYLRSPPETQQGRRPFGRRPCRDNWYYDLWEKFSYRGMPSRLILRSIVTPCARRKNVSARYTSISKDMVCSGRSARRIALTASTGRMEFSGIMTHKS